MRGEKVINICDTCKKSFSDYVSNKRGKFCSLPCYWLGKKGSKGYWLGKKRPEMVGVKNPKWKGNSVGYYNLHVWLKRYKIKTGVCERCYKKNKTDWANKSHQYKRSLKDWLELCRKCHIKYDKKHRGIATKKYGDQINKYR